MPSSIRLLRMLNHPENKENNESTSPLDELEESDVVWSSSAITAEAAAFESQPPTPLSTTSSPPFSASPSQFNAVAGISAASDQSRSPVVQQKKTATNPLLSAAGAAAISTVVAPPAKSSSPLSRSAPVKVPIWPDGRWRGGRGINPTAVVGRFEEEEEEEMDEDEEMVPPHEIVARSHRTTTFSVVEGAGRTLKGRDLSTVRNAVMRRTGFLG